MRTLAAIAASLALASPAAAQEDRENLPTPGSVVAEAAAEEWIAIAPEDLLVMDLAPAADGSARRVVIQLMPPPFSQPWVENIRTLAQAHWWDGTSVNRVQDNYVVQWGDVTEEKPLPGNMAAPNTPYILGSGENCGYHLCPAVAPIDFVHDSLLGGYKGNSAFTRGWPIGTSRNAAGVGNHAWPLHCYGYVGVGRNYAPDTGSGAELYTIIGQPQRHMDRNLAVVGRIIEGMEHLSSLPRGHGELGFYTEEEAHLRTPIVSVRLGTEIADALRFEYLDTASESFAKYVSVRANRNDTFYTVPAGGVDVCSVQVPVRRVGSAG